MFMGMDIVLPIHVIVTLCIHVSIHSASHAGAPRWLWCFRHGTAKTWSEGAALAYQTSIALVPKCGKLRTCLFSSFFTTREHQALRFAFLSTKLWVGTLVSPIKTLLDGWVSDRCTALRPSLNPAETGIPVARSWSMMLSVRNLRIQGCSSALCLFPFKNLEVWDCYMGSGWECPGVPNLWAVEAGAPRHLVAGPLRLVRPLRG